MPIHAQHPPHVFVHFPTPFSSHPCILNILLIPPLLIHPPSPQDHQLAVVDCLRSPDVTLKRKTLQLLYQMAGPANIEVRGGSRAAGAVQHAEHVQACLLCMGHDLEVGVGLAPHQWTSCK